MIVPASRLLWLCALAGAPLGGLSGAVPERAPLALGLLGLILVVTLFDALKSVALLGGLRFEPDGILRLARGRAGELAVWIHNDRPTDRVLRLGLPLPRELTSAQAEARVRVPAGCSRLDWPLVASARGRHVVPAIHLEAMSPLGLWQIRRVAPLAAEVRAYPDLFRDRAAVAAIFLKRGGLGAHVQRQVGKGREFEKLRDYIPGDSLEDVHWKATAKRGRPVTKVFQIERTQEIYVLLDASRLSGRRLERGSPVAPGANDERMLDRSLNAALLLGVAAERQGDLFGLVTFSDRIKTFVRASNGPAHYGACRDAIYTLEPEATSPDFEELASFLRNRLRRRALLLFLTSLDDPVIAESFVRGADLLRRQHLLCVAMIRPPGVQPLFQNAAVEGPDPLYGELAGHLRWQGLRELESLLRRRGIGFALTGAPTLTIDLIRQYLSVKQRQVL